MNTLNRKIALALAVAALGGMAAGCAPSEQTSDRPSNRPSDSSVVDQAETRSEPTLEENFSGRAVEVQLLPQGQSVSESEALVSHARRRQEMTMDASAMPMLSSPRVIPASEPAPYPHSTVVDRENYAPIDTNPIKLVSEEPVSTFSIDVDTGSYSNVRRMLNNGRLPPQDAVRVEEMINYFSYDYPVPDAGEAPFSVQVEQAITPWNDNTRLLQIGLQGYEPDPDSIPASNLVFLLDVSGSMNSPDKLPLLVNSMKMLTRELGEDDRVAIVVYAGASGVVLESTPGDEDAKIAAALDRLSAGGSTNGAAGIEMAYAQAREGFIEGGVNRVILATDGDFNVGTVSFEALIDLVERQRDSGIALTTLGFGQGNYNDHLMEQLADAGNGNHAYIDNLNEARKVLVDELTSTLLMIAKDVKIQIEFNPAVVAEYRLIGYENRLLNREDFNNDQVDAGDIGAGHTVTALYEIALVGSEGQRVDPLRYQNEGQAERASSQSRELAFLRLRYKAPDEDVSQLIEQPIEFEARPSMSPRLSWAASVAAFGQFLSGGVHLNGFSLADIEAIAQPARG
ncbi:MAG: VWA domain-containing protein, partial [Pseudomonadota bacterium]